MTVEEAYWQGFMDKLAQAGTAGAGTVTAPQPQGERQYIIEKLIQKGYCPTRSGSAEIADWLQSSSGPTRDIFRRWLDQ